MSPSTPYDVVVMSKYDRPCRARIVRTARWTGRRCDECCALIDTGDIAYQVNGFVMHYFCEGCGKAREVSA